MKEELIKYTKWLQNRFEEDIEFYDSKKVEELVDNFITSEQPVEVGNISLHKEADSNYSCSQHRRCARTISFPKFCVGCPSLKKE